MESLNPSSKSDDQETSLSIEESFLKEVQELKSDSTFKWISLGIDCLLFCHLTDSLDPVEFIQSLYLSLESSKEKQTRYTSRLIPIQNTCACTMTDILACTEKLLKPIFTDSSLTFSIVVKIRNNSKLDRNNVIEKVAQLVGEQHKVDLTNPQVCIVIQVLQSACGISVIPQYYAHNRFNIESQSIYEKE